MRKRKKCPKISKFIKWTNPHSHLCHQQLPNNVHWDTQIHLPACLLENIENWRIESVTHLFEVDTQSLKSRWDAIVEVDTQSLKLRHNRSHLFQSPHLVETQRRIMHDGMSLLSSQFLCAKYGDFKKSYLALPTDRMPAKTSVLKHYVILMHSRFYFDH